MTLVPDVSAVVGLAFDDDFADYAARVIDAISADGAIVPGLFWFEVNNVLLYAEKRKRITIDRVHQFLDNLEVLPLEVDDRLADRRLLELARSANLSVHDAVYLELAQRFGATLATRDDALRRAAIAVGVVLFA